jgi:hypothetical protein
LARGGPGWGSPFTDLADSSTALPPDAKQQVAQALEEDAQVLSNTQLEDVLAEQPEDIREEIIRINTEARPLSLQVALLVPLFAGLIGLLNSLGMTRLPDPVPSADLDQFLGG